jgi:hypothetical protein
MLFGHNTNVKVGETTYHVQTEDRGAAHALIDTTVYFRGRVLHRRTNNYFDLLPVDAAHEQALKQRVDEQHRTVVDAIRSGALTLALPADGQLTPLAVRPAQASAVSSAAGLKLELLNPRTWLAGKRASLQVGVRDSAGNAADGAIVTAKVDGAAVPTEFSTVTGVTGNVMVEFEMPRLASPEAALVIDAWRGNTKGHLRFQLRSKPRVPSAE